MEIKKSDFVAAFFLFFFSNRNPFPIGIAPNMLSQG
jgi:hypothetical protein|tara:strand:+ start:402 stop:509 length:108 start_codon:yes stop_codon:yes gene_type:complete